MSFPRHARSIGPIGHVKTSLRFEHCAASRWSAPGIAVRRGCHTAPSPIVRDEYAPAIPWRVALQQSPPPFHRMRPVCYESICRSSDFHRTANCVLTVCVRLGGRSTIDRALLQVNPVHTRAEFAAPRYNHNGVHEETTLLNLNGRSHKETPRRDRRTRK
jgi:hypothetical protein